MGSGLYLIWFWSPRTWTLLYGFWITSYLILNCQNLNATLWVLDYILFDSKVPEPKRYFMGSGLYLIWFWSPRTQTLLYGFWIISYLILKSQNLNATLWVLDYIWFDSEVPEPERYFMGSGLYLIWFWSPRTWTLLYGFWIISDLILKSQNPNATLWVLDYIWFDSEVPEPERYFMGSGLYLIWFWSPRTQTLLYGFWIISYLIL